MGSPISGVLAYIYLKFLWIWFFYFRYIVNILLIYPQERDLVKITDRLNKTEPTIKFTLELETNNSLTFLRYLTYKSNENLDFLKIFCEITRKNGHIHFYSHHNTNAKRRTIIGACIRALYICSME